MKPLRLRALKIIKKRSDNKFFLYLALILIVGISVIVTLFVGFMPRERVMIVDHPLTYSEQLEALRPETILIHTSPTNNTNNTNNIDTKGKLK